MNQETVNFWIAIWGAITGTIALLIEYFTFRRDRARLKVKSVFSFGSDLRFGREARHHLTVTLTNSGRGIIRIRGFAVSIYPRWKYLAIRCANRLSREHRRAQTEIGIYSCSMDPIDEIVRIPGTQTYPPKNIILEDHETKEIQVNIGEELLPALPTPKGTLIVTDHLGRRHLAPFNIFHMAREDNTKGQQGGGCPLATRGRLAKRTPLTLGKKKSVINAN